MSFLNVAIPVESVDSLLEEIRKQLDVGRFDEPKCDEIEIQPPTREIKGLIEIIQRELQIDKKAGLIARLIVVLYGEDYIIDRELIADGSCFVICLKEYEDGGAFWTDDSRYRMLDGNTFLKCEEGTIKAEKKGKGGWYLMLVNKFDRKNQ